MATFDGMWLERHHDWTWLLIEAIPDLCDAVDKRT
jgi:hypothetical protein